MSTDEGDAMRQSMWRWMWPALLASGVLAAGCGARTGPGTEVSLGQGTVVSAQCPGLAIGNESTTPATPAQTVPLAGFRVAWVLMCSTKLEDLPGRGQWQTAVTYRADTSAKDLLTQLEQPSDPPAGPDVACTADAVVPPYFVLVGADGRAIRPAVPTDQCGKPKAGFGKALGALPFRVVSDTPVRQVLSPAAQQSGCPQAFKDLMALGKPASKPATLPWSTPVTSLRMCVYGQISTGTVPVGQFESGTTITGTRLSALLTALRHAAPATKCDAQLTRYAVLTDEHSRWLLVELDGCRRFLLPDNTIGGQLDEATVRSLVS